ncbi:MAG: flavin reductase [Nocardioides sp.]
MTIHAEHPFRDPEPDPLRRFRGRVGSTVSLWTSGAEQARAGLTVTSFLVAAGRRAACSACWTPTPTSPSGWSRPVRRWCSCWAWEHRELADVFAGTAPAPGGMFRQAEFAQTTWGPRLTSAGSWAGVRLESRQDVGWSTLVTTVVEHLEVSDDDDPEPLWHRRGRYGR